MSIYEILLDAAKEGIVFRTDYNIDMNCAYGGGTDGLFLRFDFFGRISFMMGEPLARMEFTLMGVYGKLVDDDMFTYELYKKYTEFKNYLKENKIK